MFTAVFVLLILAVGAFLVLGRMSTPVQKPAARKAGHNTNAALWAPVEGSDAKEGFPRGTFVQN